MGPLHVQHKHSPLSNCAARELSCLELTIGSLAENQQLTGADEVQAPVSGTPAHVLRTLSRIKFTIGSIYENEHLPVDAQGVLGKKGHVHGQN